MPAPDVSNILTGTPDQRVTGAILSGPIIDSLPTDPFDPSAFSGLIGSGYVSESGLSLSISKSFSSIKDWSGAVVRKLLEEFDGTLSWAHLETNEQSLGTTFGEGNITITPATNSAGKRVKVAVRGENLPRKSWVFKMKDGLSRILIVVPDGQIGETEDIAFVANEAITWGVTLNSYPDADGNSLYIFTDDGVFSA